MRFMLRMKKATVTTMIHAMLRSSVDCQLPNINPLDRITVCVKGRMASARICMGWGRIDRGKKVPLSRNMGVMKRNPG